MKQKVIKKRFNLHLSQEMYDALQKKANKEFCSMSTIVIRIMSNYNDKELLDLINEEEKEFLGNQVCVFCPIEIYNYWKSFLNKNMQVAIRNILRFKFLLNENFDI